MSIQLKRRRGTEAEIDLFTPVEAEFIYNTTNKTIHVGDGSRTRGLPLPNYRQLREQKFVFALIGFGSTADAIVLNMDEALDAVTLGLAIEFKADASNTTAVTVDVDGVATQDIKKITDAGKVDLEADDILNGGIYRIVYDGTDFVLTNSSPGQASGLILLATATASNSTTIDFTGSFTSDYTEYVVVGDRVVIATNGNRLAFRVRRTGQGSFDSADGDYLFSNAIFDSTTTYETNSSTGVTSVIFASPTLSNSSTTGYSFVAELFGFGNNNTKPCPILVKGTEFASPMQGFYGAGARNTTAELDGFRVLTSGGNISTGNFYLYARQKDL